MNLRPVSSEELFSANDRCSHGEMLGRWEVEEAGLLGALWYFRGNEELIFYSWRIEDSNKEYSVPVGKGANRKDVVVRPILRCSGMRCIPFYDVAAELMDVFANFVEEAED